MSAFPAQQSQQQVDADQATQQRRERDQRTLVVIVIDDRETEGACLPMMVPILRMVLAVH